MASLGDTGRQGRGKTMRKVLGRRMVLPTLVAGAVAVGGLVAVAASGPATAATAHSKAAVAAKAASGSTTPTTIPVRQTAVVRKSTPVPARSSKRVYVLHNHKLVAYGDRHIVYTLPPSAYIPAGQALFAQDCASCHGPSAQGTQYAPNLQGLGPATIDFWITTGRMPAKNPRAVQAPVKPPQLTDKQALEVAAYVNSLDPARPFIPRVNRKNANVATGAELFALNCAACHTITGAGDALAYSTFAPSLHMNGQPTSTQVAEAVRTGPANMPRFNEGNLTDSQVADIVKYVTEKIQHPSNPGGFGLGGIGPVAEGFVGLLFGVGGLMLICYWIGDRTEKEEEEEGEAHGEGTEGDGSGEQATPEPVGGGHS